MERFFRALIALAAALGGGALASCQSSPSADAPANALPESARSMESGTCDVLDSRDWASFTEHTAAPGLEPAIRITGKVDVPSRGYSFGWQWGPVDLTTEPAALTLNLLAKAPEGVAAMAKTTEEVKYEGPALSPGYVVRIKCGTTSLTEISEIMELLKYLEPSQDAG